MGRIYEAFEIGSVALIFVQSFIKTGLAILKFIEGVSQTNRQHGDPISLRLLFSKSGK
jgi:hypothetical protein